MTFKEFLDKYKLHPKDVSLSDVNVGGDECYLYTGEMAGGFYARQDAEVEITDTYFTTKGHFYDEPETKLCFYVNPAKILDLKE